MEDQAEGLPVPVARPLPAGNLAYRQPLAQPEHRALGDPVSEVCVATPAPAAAQVHPLDTALLLDLSAISREYALRYGPQTVHDEPDLLRLLSLREAEALDEVLDFDGTVSLSEEGVELLVGRVGSLLPCPFLLEELHALADELEQEEQPASS